MAHRRIGRGAEPAQSFKNSLSRIARRGKYFDRDELPIPQRNAIGKCAAAVDSDALVRWRYMGHASRLLQSGGRMPDTTAERLTTHFVCESTK